MMILRRTRPRTATAALARSVAVVVSCASMIVCPTRATEPVPISWRDDYGGALEEARATNRLVWIQFTGPWCPNCMRMERDSFPDADVVDHAQRSFVPLKLRSDVHERLALGFNLSGLPATVLVAPTREVIAVRQGYLGPDELEQVLSEGVTTWRGREAAAGADKAKPDAATRSEAASARPKGEPKLSLAGYCPVSLVGNRKLVAGKAEHAVQHEGKTYRFASAAMSDLFRKDPERYIPANGGDCPVTELDRGTASSGNPRWGVLYQGRLYLCASDDARRRFLDEPERYAMVDIAEQGFCAHCLGETGLLIRGDPKCAITRDGLRYWFPDPTHRAAFLAANPTASEASTSDGPTSTTVRR
jgi:YHS domain-containing protein/thiol-disulfide isomerase/thioredoxin